MATLFKHALVDHPDPAWKVAQGAGISEVRVSKLSTGLASPRPWEVVKLAAILKKDPQEIFPEAPDPVAI